MECLRVCSTMPFRASIRMIINWALEAPVTIFRWLPLLPAFALYFGGWHALCAFDNIHNYLRKDYPTLSFKLVYLKTLPFTFLAIVFLCAFLWYCNIYTQFFDPFPILFIFISLITLPHLIIAHQMNNGTELFFFIFFKIN